MSCVVCVTDWSRHRDQRTLHRDIVVEFVPAFYFWLVVAFYHLFGGRQVVKFSGRGPVLLAMRSSPE